MPEGDERDLTELMIRMQRTISTSSQFGYGYPDVFEDFRIAEEICRKLTNRPEIMPAQVGIWSYLLVRGSVGAANVVLEPLSDVLDDPATAWFAPEIKSCLGYGAFYQGRLDEAHRWLLEAWEGYRARSIEAASSPFWPLPHDAVPITAVALACVAALQGATEESMLWERRAIVNAQELGFPAGPFSSAFVSVYLAWIRMITGNLERHASSGGGRSRSGSGTGSTTSSSSERSTDCCLSPASPATSRNSRSTEWGWTSSATGRSGRHTSASSPRTTTTSATPTRPSDRLDEALERTTTSGELVDQPDLLRLRAEILTAAYPDRTDEAVDDLVDAIEIGLAQGSLVLALRAANDLARPPHDSAPDWSDRLRTVVERFPPKPPRAPNWPRRSTSSGSEGGALPGLGGHPRGRHGRAGHPVRAERRKLDRPVRAHHRVPAGWRLGGKGASSRGPNGRIEEHGLHVLLGYYDHTFDVMRRCYEALDRGRSDPCCSIRTWDDAVAPSNLVGVVDRHDGEWEPWVATFSPFAGRPGGGVKVPPDRRRWPRPTSWSGPSACWSTSSNRSRSPRRPREARSGSAPRPRLRPPAPRHRRRR